MATKYRTSKHAIKIEELEVERESEHGVWVRGSRAAKHTDWHQYHETYNEAFNFLECRYSQKLSDAESKLDTAKKEYLSVLRLIK